MHSFDTIAADTRQEQLQELPSLDAIVMEMQTAWSATPLFPTHEEKISSVNLLHSGALSVHSSATIPKAEGHREFAAISASLPPMFDLRDEPSYSQSSTPGSVTSSPETPGFAPEEWTGLTTGHGPPAEEPQPFQYFFGTSAETEAAEYLTGAEVATAWGLAWQPPREAAEILAMPFSLERASAAYATGPVHVDDSIKDCDDAGGAAPIFFPSELRDLSTRDESGWTRPEARTSCLAKDVGEYTLDSALQQIWSSSSTVEDDTRQNSHDGHSTTPALLTAKHNLVCAVVRTPSACDCFTCSATVLRGALDDSTRFPHLPDFLCSFAPGLGHVLPPAGAGSWPFPRHGQQRALRIFC
jgi:hypothetical protein